MKNIKNLITIIAFIILLSVVAVGCTTNKVEDNTNKVTDNTPNNSTNNPTNGMQENRDVQGRIVKFDENGVHLQVGEKVDVYNINKDMRDKYYVGENVHLKYRDENNYDISLNENYDYNKMTTSAGEPIKRVTGTIGDVADDFVTAVTEMGDIKVNNPGNFNMAKGSQVMFDYVEMSGGNKLISFYDEASKINVKIKDISRDSSGMMKIMALSTDNREYIINTNTDTFVNFAHSTLKKDEEIIVYPHSMSGDIPAVVEAKMILKK